MVAVGAPTKEAPVHGDPIDFISYRPPSINPEVSDAVRQALEQALITAQNATSLSDMVHAVWSGMRVVGLMLLVQVLHKRDEPFRLRQVPVSCPKCKGPMDRDKNLRSRSRYTRLGKLTYRRCGYLCENPGCDHRVFPVDQSLGLMAALRGHSLEFAKELVLLCTVVPFGKGCEMFERLVGFAVSTKLARALTFTIGTNLFDQEMERAQELWDLRCQEPELFEPVPATLRQMKRHARVYVMMDSSKVGLQEGKRGRKAPRLKTLRKLLAHEQGKAIRARKRQKLGADAAPVPEIVETDEDNSWRDVRGLLIFREEDLVQTSKKRRQIIHRRVLAHVGSKEEWMRLVHMALHDEGVYTAHEVVIIADGGSGIWELFDELLPPTCARKVVQILDWYHAASHLWAVGRALKGSKTPQQKAACRAWVNTLLDYLAEGKVANVLQRLRKLKKLSEAAAETVRKCIDYFETHQGRMRYAWYRKQDMLIGSGAMESVHAWVIQPRCRLPGMRWSLAGINAMLRLRCSWASDRWDEDFVSAARRAPATPQKLKAAA